MRKMKSRVVVGSCGAVLLASSVAGAQAWELHRAPVAGGDIRELAFDPHEEGVVYAAVVGPGIYKSIDGGVTFTEDALPGEMRHEPRTVLPSSAVPGVTLVCVPSTDAVFRREGAGAWQPVLTTTDLGCTALAEGKDAGTFFATTYTTKGMVLHTSTNGGVAWASQPLAWPAPVSIFEERLKVSSLVQLPSGRLVFAFSSDPPAFASPGQGNVGYSDDGKALVRVDGPASAVADLAWNGSEIHALVDSSNLRLAKTTDGVAWPDNFFSFGSPSFSPYVELKYVPSRDTFLALGRERLLESTPAPDYKFAGDKPLYGTHGVTNTRTSAADPHSTLILTGTSAGGVGVRRGRNDGKNDGTISTGIHAAKVDRALFDVETGYAYAAGAHGTVFFGATGALSLQPIFAGRGPREEAITAIAYDLQDPKRVVIALDREGDVDNFPGLMELGDATAEPVELIAPPFGAHPGWKEVADPRVPVADTSVTALIVDGATRYVGFNSNASGSAPAQHLFRSTDDGKTYQPLSLSLEGGVTALVRDPKTPTTLYVAGGGFNNVVPTAHGLFRSTDSGDNWTQLAPFAEAGVTIRFLALDPEEPQHLWAASSSWTLAESVDGGDTFTDVSFAPSSDVRTLALAFSPIRKQLLIARTDGIHAHTAATEEWPRVATPPGIALGLAPDGSGVATDSGLFVIEDALGEPGTGPGSGGNGAGGTSTAGNAGKPGGGSTNGGSTNGGNGNAGASAPGDGGSGDTGGNGKAPGKSSGCGCRTATGSAGHSPAVALMLLLAFAARRRRY